MSKIDTGNLKPTHTIREAQLRLLKILEALDAVCKKHDIPYWLESGTALGAVRDKGFIPWDDDIDVGIRTEDYTRLMTAIQASMSEFPADAKFVSRETEHGHHHGSPRIIDTAVRGVRVYNFMGKRCVRYQNPFVDIFPFQRYPHDRNTMMKISKRRAVVLKPIRAFSGRAYYKVYEAWMRKFSRPDGAYYGYSTLRRITTSPYEGFFPLKTAVFEGREFPVPGNVDAYLTAWYGKDYMTPRHSHTHLVWLQEPAAK